MSREEIQRSIAEALGETEERPRTQIASVIGVLGEQGALELLAETQRVEESGGMLLPDGSRRRTPGGVFFVLARRKLTPADRVAIFGQGPQHPRPPTERPPQPPKPAGNGGPPAHEPAPMRRRAVEVVTLTAGQRPRAAGSDPVDTARLLASMPVQTRADLGRAVDRASARKQIASLIRGLAPLDQRLALLDVLAELEPGAGGEPRRLSSAPAPPPGSVIPPATSTAPPPAMEPRPRAEMRPPALPQSQTPPFTLKAPDEPRSTISDSAPPSPARRRIVTPLVPPPSSADDEGGGGTLRETVLAAIRSRPGIGLGELALKAYHEDNPVNRKRVQTIVSNLKRDGKVRTSARGRFEPA